MDTQNTTIHMRLWNRSFWQLALANLFLTMSVSMLIPTLGMWMKETFSDILSWQIAIAYLFFGLGTLLSGGFNSYLVQRYRRNRVCKLSILLQASLLAAFYFFLTSYIRLEYVWGLACLMGASWGLSQLVLTSTLTIDASESRKRTEANHASAWFRRISVVLGGAIGLGLYGRLSFAELLLASMACSGAAYLMLSLVKFPFRAPEDNLHIWSLDRFFLLRGYPLALNLILITSIMGMVFSVISSAHFYILMLGGYAIAMLAERFAFPNADLRSEVFAGLIFIIIALTLGLTRHLDIVRVAVPVLLGFGFGIIGTRFLLFFIKLADHCQRGTSQSTYVISYGTGITAGIASGYCLFHGNVTGLLTCSLIVACISLVLYNFIIHPWYITHKNR